MRRRRHCRCLFLAECSGRRQRGNLFVSVTHISLPSGKPNQCARAGTGAIAGDKGGHTSFTNVISDLQSGSYVAAIAHESDNHLLVGTAGPYWVDLISLLFED